MSSSVAPGGRKALPAVAKPKEAADGKAGAGAEIERLRACVGQLEEAMRVEGIARSFVRERKYTSSIRVEEEEDHAL